MTFSFPPWESSREDSSSPTCRAGHMLPWQQFSLCAPAHKNRASKSSEALSDAVRRKKLLPYASISRQVKRSGLTFFNLFSSLANIYRSYLVKNKKDIPCAGNILKNTVSYHSASCVGISQQVQRVRFRLLNYTVVPLLG